MGRLDGAVVLISGGARGMGASHARGFVREGAKVVIGDVLEADGQALAAELGDAAAYIRLDVTSDQSWKDAVAFTEATFGPIRVLVNNAGILQMKPWLDTTTDEWRRVLEVNLTGQFIGIREVVPSMRKVAGDKAIINISSAAGIMGMPAVAAYTASKFGVRGITKVAALEFAGDGIRVVSIHPGTILTPMTADLVALAGADQPADTPIPRAGRPEEVTALVLFLASEATFMTGSEWVPDGGLLLGTMGQAPQ